MIRRGLDPFVTARGWLRAFVLVGLSLLLTSCGAGIVGVVLGIQALSKSGSGPADLAPVVSDLRVSAPETPDRIHVDFQVVNEDEGRLSARVEVVRFKRGPNGELVQDGGPAPATPIPGSGPMEDLDGAGVTRFIWDAKGDLKDESAEVQVIVTPYEDGVEGKRFKTGPFLAGNTPPFLGEVVLGSQASRLVVTFEVVDLESHLVDLLGVEISIDGSEFILLPRTLLDLLPGRFSGSPVSGGPLQGLVLDLEDLAEVPDIPEELKDVGRPGFVGVVCVRLTIRDFPGEDPRAGVGCLLLDNNDEPFVEILPVAEMALTSGVVPIRYRVFDREKNPVQVHVEVDSGDGLGFRPAMEFPAGGSDGRSGLATLDPGEFGDAGNPAHVFLWDALSQAIGGESLTLAITASDRECGQTSSQNLTALSNVPFLRAYDLTVGGGPGALAVGDFDRDGFLCGRREPWL